MDWDNDFTLKFIKLYQNESIIWNPSHAHYKNKPKVHKAWVRLAAALKKSVQELKAKKNSLMATFRGHWRRKQASKRSAEDEYEVYKPIWFAYDCMEQFLAPMYDSKADNKAVNKECHGPKKMRIKERDPLDKLGHSSTAPPPIKLILQNTRKTTGTQNANWRLKTRHPVNDVADMQKKIKQTLTTLNNYISDKTAEDDCDLYAKLLAKKLRKYSELERLQIMYEIDGLLLSRPAQQESRPSSPFNYSGPLPSQDFNASQCCANISPTQFCVLINDRPSSTTEGT